mgnify:CR=1 FL=1
MNKHYKKLYKKMDFRVDFYDKIKHKSGKTNKVVLSAFSLDMHDINKYVSDSHARMKILTKYFKDRPYVKDSDNSDPKHNAFRMLLLGEIATACSKTIEMTDCKPDDIYVNTQWNKDDKSCLEIHTGIHKRLGNKKAAIVNEVLHKSLSHFLKEFNEMSRNLEIKIGNSNEQYLDKMKSQSLSDDVEYDEETESMLNMLKWDKTIKGQA